MLKPLGVRVHAVDVSTDAGIANLAVTHRRHGEAAIVPLFPMFVARQASLVTLMAQQRIPAVYGWRQAVEAGGLISYGPQIHDLFRQAGGYAARILNGAMPADLPVQQPTTFELVVNAKTAKQLGLTVPPSVLARADEIMQ